MSSHIHNWLGELRCVSSQIHGLMDELTGCVSLQIHDLMGELTGCVFTDP